MTDDPNFWFFVVPSILFVGGSFIWLAVAVIQAVRKSRQAAARQAELERKAASEKERRSTLTHLDLLTEDLDRAIGDREPAESIHHYQQAIAFEEARKGTNTRR